MERLLGALFPLGRAPQWPCSAVAVLTPLLMPPLPAPQPWVPTWNSFSCLLSCFPPGIGVEDSFLSVVLTVLQSCLSTFRYLLCFPGPRSVGIPADSCLLAPQLGFLSSPHPKCGTGHSWSSLGCLWPKGSSFCLGFSGIPALSTTSFTCISPHSDTLHRVSEYHTCPLNPRSHFSSGKLSLTSPSPPIAGFYRIV